MTTEPSEAEIAALVDLFYLRVRADPQLGPLFEREIGDGWDAHLGTMVRFWSSVMLGTGRYKGNPVAVHKAVPGIEPAMFEHWLDLFRATCHDLFPPEIAERFQEKAERIAESLKLAMWYSPENPWPIRGEPLRRSG